MQTRGFRPRPFSGRLVETIRRHPTRAFFIIAYAVSWLLWIPILLFGLPVFDAARHAPSLYLLPGIAIGVTGTAFALTAITQGRDGVRRLVQRLTWWRVGLRWYGVAVLLLPLVAILIAVALVSPDALRSLAPSALLLYPAAYLSHFFFGPLFEESGWRGFALPRMQHRYGPLRGTFLLGLLWSAWHFFLYVPLWFGSGDLAGGLVSLATFTVYTTFMTVLFTWLFNNTRASLLLSILLHGSVDGSTTYFQVLAARGVLSAPTAGAITSVGMILACLVLALGLLVVTRGRLGYGRYQREAEPLDLHPSTAQPARLARS